MQRLLTFLLRYRAFNLFLLLEMVAFWLIFNKNVSQNLVFFSTSNRAIGEVYEATGSVTEYLSLKNSNKLLAEENARLRKVLSSLYAQTKNNDAEELSTPYVYLPAKVINNSVLFSNNYFTINAGKEQGVRPGMGVITSNGVAGQIKSSSKNFATAYSLLHANVSISSQLKRSGVLCTTRWQAGSINKAKLMHLPNSTSVSEGDSVVTSGYNAVYPQGILIGTVSSSVSEEDDGFKSVNINLATDFAKLSYVYVVQNNQFPELDSLWKESAVNATLE